MPIVVRRPILGGMGGGVIPVFLSSVVWPNVKSISFNGSTQYIYVAAPADIQALESWTLAKWGYVTAWPVAPAAAQMFYIGKYDTTNTSVLWLYTNTTDKLDWRMTWWEDNVVRLGGVLMNAPSPYRPADLTGAWHHYMLTYDHPTTTMTFRVDGNSVWTSVADYRLSRLFSGRTYPANRVVHGAALYNSAIANPFPGYQDEMVLCSGVVPYTSLVTAGAAIDLAAVPGLLHWYRCGDAAGDVSLATVADQVGTADMTVVNNAPFVGDAP